MYLVSIYFDEKTNKKLQQYINKVAERTGNTFMLDEKVPPHITVSAFETTDKGGVIDILNNTVLKLKSGTLEWVSIGSFSPYVIFLSPVLNEYLHNMSALLYEELTKMDGIKMSPYYRPFQWVPHSTIGKKLSKEEMKIAFDVLHNSFSPLEGTVVRIGLAKPNPHRDIASWKLM